MSHTPGPWYGGRTIPSIADDLILGYTRGLVVRTGQPDDCDTQWIADCGDPSNPENAANLQLIARAPQMLLLLKMLDAALKSGALIVIKGDIHGAIEREIHAATSTNRQVRQ